jgi:hypothetical protein
LGGDSAVQHDNFHGPTDAEQLSFAQFEREIAGERIRDKIAASKAKGMWMGGTVPLGYRVHERKLVVIPEEARDHRVDAVMPQLGLGSMARTRHGLCGWCHLLTETTGRDKNRPTSPAARLLVSVSVVDLM